MRKMRQAALQKHTRLLFSRFSYNTNILDHQSTPLENILNCKIFSFVSYLVGPVQHPQVGQESQASYCPRVAIEKHAGVGYFTAFSQALAVQAVLVHGQLMVYLFIGKEKENERR